MHIAEKSGNEIASPDVIGWLQHNFKSPLHQSDTNSHTRYRHDRLQSISEEPPGPLLNEKSSVLMLFYEFII